MHRPLIGATLAAAVSFLTCPVGIALVFGAIGFAAAGARRGRS